MQVVYSVNAAVLSIDLHYAVDSQAERGSLQRALNSFALKHGFVMPDKNAVKTLTYVRGSTLFIDVTEFQDLGLSVITVSSFKDATDALTLVEDLTTRLSAFKLLFKRVNQRAKGS